MLLQQELIAKLLISKVSSCVCISLAAWRGPKAVTVHVYVDHKPAPATVKWYWQGLYINMRIKVMTENIGPVD